MIESPPSSNRICAERVHIYDESQQKAIEAEGGEWLVLAPPGCGKTDILAERIAQARCNGVKYEDMLCLTFTNRASRGMRDRIRQRLNEDPENLFVGNIHRFCSNLIYTYGVFSQCTEIVDEDESCEIIMSFNKDYFCDQNGNADKMRLAHINNVASYITQRRLDQPIRVIIKPQTFEQYYKESEKVNFEPQAIDIVDSKSRVTKYALEYIKYKRERCLLDFSDILIFAYEALRRDCDCNIKRYRWIQVDEVQDLNSLQMSIIDEIKDPTFRNTIMFLGDEKQSIFSFMGAGNSRLETLRQRCEGRIMSLSFNYRSSQKMLSMLNTYAEKELGTEANILPAIAKRDGEESCFVEQDDKYDLILAENSTYEEEEKRVAKMVKHYLEYNDEQVAVIVPTNRCADRVSAILQQQDINLFKVSGSDMFRSDAYKTIISVLRVVLDEPVAMSWARILHTIGGVEGNVEARNLIDKLSELELLPYDLSCDIPYIDAFNSIYSTQELVFFDTETTGLDTSYDDIVQIAAFKVYRGEIVKDSEFNIFLHTDKPLPKEIDGKENPLITAYATSSHYNRAEGLQLFLNYLGSDILLGHNVNYDYAILKNNVLRELDIEIDFKLYDSLQLSRLTEPSLGHYRLSYLLEVLHLKGCNSHLAHDDIAATKSLVDYCYKKTLVKEAQRKRFFESENIVCIRKNLLRIKHVFENLNGRLDATTNSKWNIADEILQIKDAFFEKGLIEDVGAKFNIFLDFIRSEWMPEDEGKTLKEQIVLHINDLETGLSEADLAGKWRTLDDRVYVMTVHKSKGLEFDNVILLAANDGTYPFFRSNNVLNSPYLHTKQEIIEAKKDIEEDARKFYVALSRAKKRLCISYSSINSHGIPTSLTPFIKSVLPLFYAGKRTNDSMKKVNSTDKSNVLKQLANRFSATFQHGNNQKERK